jgi:hypothetical protein
MPVMSSIGKWAVTTDQRRSIICTINTILTTPLIICPVCNCGLVLYIALLRSSNSFTALSAETMIMTVLGLSTGKYTGEYSSAHALNWC